MRTRRSRAVCAGGLSLLVALLVLVLSPLPVHGVVRFDAKALPESVINLDLLSVQNDGQHVVERWDKRSGKPLKVFHCHIPKTGGRTLRLSFPEIAHLKPSPFPPCCVGADGVNRMMTSFRNREDLAFISFEAPIGAVYERMPEHAVVISLVRDPVQHVLSQIGHLMHSGRIRTVGQWAAAIEKNRFVHYNSTNMQTHYLGGKFAIQNLDRIIVGITDYFEESVCLFLHAMGRFDADLCRCDGPSARTRLRSMIKHENAEVSAPGTPVTYAQIAVMRRITKQDLQLYHQAVIKFFERVRAVEKETGVRLTCN